jgi:uncharacterized spore protein YtfJ
MDAQGTTNAPTGSAEVPDFLQPLLERMHSSAKAETVFGASRQERGRTIIPVAKVRYGFGGGMGGASGKKRKGEPAEAQAEEGVGGGGGLTVTPIGFLEVTDSDSGFKPITKSRLVAVSTLLAGFLLGLAVGRLKD